MNLHEADTRANLINKQLSQAGWNVGQRLVITEARLTGQSHIAEIPEVYQAGDEYIDYLLLDREGNPIAIVEAKRTSRDPLEGQRQAADYADRLKANSGIEPFIFLTNGHEIWFWDRSLYPPRPVSGYLTLADLETRAFQRRYRETLRLLAPNRGIINRHYQLEAVRRVTEAVEESRRHFLLVMATGTGKTRTVIALIDLLFRAKWINRVLFLADRRELVRQALADFKTYMPHESRARLEGGLIENDARIHVTTYPSMIQIYNQLSVGYYDLIIADESHRSIYNHYRTVLDKFDALQIGLTATPTDYIDHNTFTLFDCPDGLPTYSYPYDDAVAENFLANYKVHHALTNFQIEGIKAGELPNEWQNTLAEQGIDLSEINFSGTDLERRVTNRGTTDAIVREFMEFCRRDATGTLPAKTIFFAMSHHHALEILKSFQRLYPNLQRQGLVQVIDSQMERADKLLDDFKRRDMPRIAISVDMLDTGIDVPAIQNLVFAKPVFSQVKFWQMIGRGTRLWTDPQTGRQKEGFLILDFWNNFHYFNMNPDTATATSTEPIPVRLFRLRLDKLQLLRSYGMVAEANATRTQLQQMLAELPHDNVNIRPHHSRLTQLATDTAWALFDETLLAELKQSIAPLLRFLPNANLAVLTFAVKTERLANAYLAGETEQIENLRPHLIQDLQLLPTGLPDVAAVQNQHIWMQSDGFWAHLDYGRILTLQETFAPLMRYRQRRQQEIITLNLPDHIAARWIMYGPSGEGTLKETYREQVQTHVRQLADHHPTLLKLKARQPLNDADITDLAQTLDRADLFINAETLREAYEQPKADLIDFMGHILGLAHVASREEEIRAAFDQFLADHPTFTATQLSFLRMVRTVIIQQNRLTQDDLRRPPFTRLGLADELFNPPQLQEIIRFTQQLLES